METQSGATGEDERRGAAQAGAAGDEEHAQRRTVAAGLGALMADLRALRREIEGQIVPLGHSIDGRDFSYQHSPVGKLPPLGGFVTLRPDGGAVWFGQVITREVREIDAGELLGSAPREGTPTTGRGDVSRVLSAKVTLRSVIGEGIVLGRIGEGRFVFGHGDEGFSYAELCEATPDEIDAYLTAVRERVAPLEVGVARAATASVHLDAKGFNRHSFLCGQSGSGKTFSLGVILERLLLETDLRLVVIDPNSDFVRLAELLDLEAVNRTRALPLDRAVYDDAARRYREATAAVRVLRPASVAEGEELRLRLYELDPHVEAQVLRIDPLRDREEYAVFHDAVEVARSSSSLEDAYVALSRDERPEVRALATRVKNLGVDEWEIWRPEKDPSVIETLRSDDWRCLVIDVGRLSRPAEKATVAAAVLHELWRDRDRRRPILVVVDEAHNVFPAQPDDGLLRTTASLGMLIAAEGRKFGLYLLLASQRPGKIHPNVLSQCENLILMRMNSRGDLAQLTETFSHVPASLMAEATRFGQGESLVAGRLVPAPTLLRFGGRLSAEGGGDVPTTWARRPRSSASEAGA